MADLKAVQDAVQALTDEVTALSTAVSAEIARVEALIASLQNTPPTGINPADLDPIVAQLQTVVSNLKSTQSVVDGERPTPPAA